MTSRTIPAREERRHQARRDPWWGETWGFEFAAPDAALGGFVQLTVYPRRSVAWFWAAVVGEGRRYILCRDDDLAPPADPDVLDVRGSGLWSHAICETPLEHWTVAMEAFAVEMEDPFDAWRGERGDRVGLAFDLEWESPATSAVWSSPSADVDRYDVPCVVNGVLQIGDETLAVIHEGWRHHAWGRLDWSSSMLGGVRRNAMGAHPTLDRSDEADGSADPAIGRTRVADAPFLADRPDGSAAHLLWSLDRMVSDGRTAPGWTQQRVEDGQPPQP